MRRWLKWTPGLRLLSAYEASWLRADLVAGLVLAAILVPVGMAYAELAGLPPVFGLYASLLPMLAYTVFGPSRTMVMGPDSATASLVAAAIIPLALGNPSHRIALAAMLAVMVGVMSLVVGVARLGFIAALLSKPVRIGYMNGIAVVVVVSQLAKLFGFSAPAESMWGRLSAFGAGIQQTNFVALAMGVASLVVILGCRWLLPKVPGPLVVVVLATGATAIFGLTQYGIATVGVLPQGLPLPSWPAVDFQQSMLLVAGAFGIAVITLTDTSVLSQSFASRFGQDVSANEEFIALGAANLATGLFQGFPISGSQTRTAINQSAGAKTPLSGLVAALVLGLLLIATPWLLATLPISVLAAVVISAGFELADIHGSLRLLKVRRTEFALLVATFAGVLFLGVLPGVFFAVGLSMLNFIRRQWWPHDAVLGRVPGVKGYHDVSDFADAEQVPGLLLWRFDAPLFFANAGIFRSRMLARIRDANVPVSRVVIAAEPLLDVDTTAADVLGELIDELHAKGIQFGLAELKHPVREHLERYGLIDLVGTENLYPTIGSAVHSYVKSTRVEWTDWQDAEETVV